MNLKDVLPLVCVFWYPSRAYVGFCEVDDYSVHKQAEDIFGQEINLWWEFKGGAWELAEDQSK